MQNVPSLENCYSRIFDFHFQIGETAPFFPYMFNAAAIVFAMKRAHALRR